MSNQNNVNNAHKIHLVLLDVVTRVVHTKFEEIIKIRNTSDHPYQVRKFLKSIYETPLKNLNSESFQRALENYLTNNKNAYPNNLDIFDISACACIAKLLKLTPPELKKIDKIRQLRNKYYGHLTFLEIDNSSYHLVMKELKQLTKELAINDQVRDKFEKEINEIEQKTSIDKKEVYRINRLICETILHEKEIFSEIEGLKNSFLEFTLKYENYRSIDSSNLQEDLLKLSASIKQQNSEELTEKLSNIFSKCLNENSQYLTVSFKSIENSLNVITNNTQSLLDKSSKNTDLTPQLLVPINLPNKASNFVGREQNLEDINDLFLSHQFVCLFAFSGTGKTLLASHYGHYFREHYENSIVRWFKSETFTKCLEDYKIFGQLLKINEVETITLENLVNQVNTRLTEITQITQRNVLLIVDNLEKYEDIRDFFNDNLPEQVKVLITTRNSDLEYEKIKYIKLEPFGINEATRFIELSNVKLSKDSIEKLLDSIGITNEEKYEVLPIKLKIAVAFIKKDYFGFFLMNLEKLDFSSFWETLIETVKSRDAKAFSLLQHISYLDPDFIMLDILTYLAGEELDSRVIDILKDLSLIELTSLVIKENKFHNYSIVGEEIFNFNGFKMHRLIQKEVRNYTRFKDAKNEENILAKINEIFDDNFDDLSHLYSNRKSILKEKKLIYHDRYSLRHKIQLETSILGYLRYLDDHRFYKSLSRIWSIRSKIGWFNLINRNKWKAFLVFRETFRYLNSLPMNSDSYSNEELNDVRELSRDDLMKAELFIGVKKIGKIIGTLVIKLVESKFKEMLLRKYENFEEFLNQKVTRLNEIYSSIYKYLCEKYTITSDQVMTKNDYIKYLRLFEIEKLIKFIQNLLIRKKQNIQPLIGVCEWVDLARNFLRKEIRPRNIQFRYKKRISKGCFRYFDVYGWDTDIYFHPQGQQYYEVKNIMAKRKYDKEINAREKTFGGYLNNLIKILRIYALNTTYISVPLEPSNEHCGVQVDLDFRFTMGYNRDTGSFFSLNIKPECSLTEKEYSKIIKCLKRIVEDLSSSANKQSNLEQFEAIEKISFFNQDENVKNLFNLMNSNENIESYPIFSFA